MLNDNYDITNIEKDYSLKNILLSGMRNSFDFYAEKIAIANNKISLTDSEEEKVKYKNVIKSYMTRYVEINECFSYLSYIEKVEPKGKDVFDVRDVLTRLEDDMEFHVKKNEISFGYRVSDTFPQYLLGNSEYFYESLRHTLKKIINRECVSDVMVDAYCFGEGDTCNVIIEISDDYGEPLSGSERNCFDIDNQSVLHLDLLRMILVKEFVAKMGGEIEVDNRISGGRTFRISFPLVVAEGVSPKKARLSKKPLMVDSSQMKSIRVLIAGAKYDYAEKIKSVLAELNVTKVDIHRDYDVSQKDLQTKGYNIILLEHLWSDDSIYDFVNKIEDNCNGCIPEVVVYSPFIFSDEQLSEFSKNSFDACINGEVNKKNLQEIIVGSLARRKTTIENSNLSEEKIEKIYSESVIDIKRLMEVSNGDIEEMRMLVYLFCNITSQDVYEAEKNIDTDYWYNKIKKIRGAAGSIGAMELKQICENALHNRDIFQRKISLKKIKEEMEKINQYQYSIQEV